MGDGKANNEKSLAAAITAIEAAHVPMKRALGQLRRVDRVDVEAFVAGATGVIDQLKIGVKLLQAAKLLALSEDDSGRIEG